MGARGAAALTMGVSLPLDSSRSDRFLPALWRAWRRRDQGAGLRADLSPLRLRAPARCTKSASCTITSAPLSSNAALLRRLACAC